MGKQLSARGLIGTPALLTAALVLAAACSASGADNSTTSSCGYEVNGDTLAELPANLYPYAHVEPGDGLVQIFARDTQDPAGEDVAIVAPPCLKAGALAMIAQRQAADTEQAQRGVAFEDRVY